MNKKYRLLCFFLALFFGDGFDYNLVHGVEEKGITAGDMAAENTLGAEMPVAEQEEVKSLFLNLERKTADPAIMEQERPSTAHSIRGSEAIKEEKGGKKKVNQDEKARKSSPKKKKKEGQEFVIAQPCLIRMIIYWLVFNNSAIYGGYPRSSAANEKFRLKEETSFK